MFNSAAALVSGNATVIALVSIITTGTVAIAGLVVQIVLARAATSRAERLRRYNELVSVYSEVGRALSSDTFALNRLFKFSKDGKLNSLGAYLNAANVKREYTKLALATEPRHALKMLRLHAASSEVIQAVERLSRIIDDQPGNLSNEEAKPWWDAKLAAVENALREYYELAGQDARRKLKSRRSSND